MYKRRYYGYSSRMGGAPIDDLKNIAFWFRLPNKFMLDTGS